MQPLNSIGLNDLVIKKKQMNTDVAGLALREYNK